MLGTKGVAGLYTLKLLLIMILKYLESIEIIILGAENTGLKKFIFVSLVMLVVIIISREKQIKPCVGARIFRLERVMIIVEFMNMLGWWING